MAQFDVYENNNPNSNELIPYLLDIQNDILNNLSSRVVVPLVLNMNPARVLNPQFNINKTQVTMSTAELASISQDNLGSFVCSLKKHEYEIINATDFMITGF